MVTPQVPVSLAAARQLLVEGKDAKDFFDALIEKQGLVGFQVHNFGGIREFRRFFRAFCSAPGFMDVVSVGVVRDAETDSRGAFQSICDGIRTGGFEAPAAPEMRVGDRPSWSVLILPDASSPGMLEDLCMRSVADSPIIPCIDDYFACIGNAVGAPRNAAKARACAFLASRPEPKPSVGIAAKAGYWPWDSPAFDHVKRFLQAM